MRVFTARYPGACAAACGDRIAAGDDVTYTDDELVHADCADGERDGRQRQPDPCPRCWLVHRGECP